MEIKNSAEPSSYPIDIPPNYELNPNQPQIFYPPQTINVPPNYELNPNQPQILYPPQTGQIIIQTGGPQQSPYILYNSQIQQNQDNIKEVHLKYSELHFKMGISLIIIGILTCIIDPLVPILIRYIHSIFLAGIFMVISGATSISGSKQKNKCHLIVSMVFDILASLNLASGLILGIAALYIPGIGGYGIFNILYCSILFLLVIWDSSLKCSEICCGIRQNPPLNQQPPNIVYVYNTPCPPS